MKHKKKTADIIMILVILVFLLLVSLFDLSDIYITYGFIVLMTFYFIGSWTERKFGDK